MAAAAFQAARPAKASENFPSRTPLIYVHHYERRLPHWDLVGHPMFVTFSLKGALPASRVFPPASTSGGKAFVAMDRLLDRARAGPLYLRIPEVAACVVQAIQDGECKFGRYELHAYTVMPNHVHLLVTPRVDARRWLGPLKGYTAYLANRILGRNGVPFWQEESYDHLVRDDLQFQRIRRYILDNPVKAGFVSAPEEYPWSGVWPPKRRLQP